MKTIPKYCARYLNDALAAGIADAEADLQTPYLVALQHQDEIKNPGHRYYLFMTREARAKEMREDARKAAHDVRLSRRAIRRGVDFPVAFDAGDGLGREFGQIYRARPEWLGTRAIIAYFISLAPYKKAPRLLCVIRHYDERGRQVFAACIPAGNVALVNATYRAAVRWMDGRGGRS